MRPSCGAASHRDEGFKGSLAGNLRELKTTGNEEWLGTFAIITANSNELVNILQVFFGGILMADV